MSSCWHDMTNCWHEMSGQIKSMYYFVFRLRNQHQIKNTHTKGTTMVMSNDKDWPKNPSLITKNYVKDDKGSEEDLIPSEMKDILEKYLDNSDEPSYFFKGVVIGLFFCLTFWTIVIILMT